MQKSSFFKCKVHHFTSSRCCASIIVLTASFRGSGNCVWYRGAQVRSVASYPNRPVSERGWRYHPYSLSNGMDDVCPTPGMILLADQFRNVAGDYQVMAVVMVEYQGVRRRRSNSLWIYIIPLRTQVHSQIKILSQIDRCRRETHRI